MLTMLTIVGWVEENIGPSLWNWMHTKFELIKRNENDAAIQLKWMACWCICICVSFRWLSLSAQSLCHSLFIVPTNSLKMQKIKLHKNLKKAKSDRETIRYLFIQRVHVAIVIHHRIASSASQCSISIYSVYVRFRSKTHRWTQRCADMAPECYYHHRLRRIHERWIFPIFPILNANYRITFEAQICRKHWLPTVSRGYVFLEFDVGISAGIFCQMAREQKQNGVLNKFIQSFSHLVQLFSTHIRRLWHHFYQDNRHRIATPICRLQSVIEYLITNTKIVFMITPNSWAIQIDWLSSSSSLSSSRRVRSFLIKIVRLRLQHFTFLIYSMTEKKKSMGQKRKSLVSLLSMATTLFQQ